MSYVTAENEQLCVCVYMYLYMICCTYIHIYIFAHVGFVLLGRLVEKYTLDYKKHFSMEQQQYNRNKNCLTCRIKGKQLSRINVTSEFVRWKFIISHWSTNKITIIL